MLLVGIFWSSVLPRWKQEKRGQILEKSGQIWGNEATTSNEFVAVVTFSRQYILIGSCSHAMFYVAHVLLLRVHCRKALKQNRVYFLYFWGRDGGEPIFWHWVISKILNKDLRGYFGEILKTCWKFLRKFFPNVRNIFKYSKKILGKY